MASVEWSILLHPSWHHWLLLAHRPLIKRPSTAAVDRLWSLSRYGISRCVIYVWSWRVSLHVFGSASASSSCKGRISLGATCSSALYCGFDFVEVSWWHNPVSGWEMVITSSNRIAISLEWSHRHFGASSSVLRISNGFSGLVPLSSIVVANLLELSLLQIVTLLIFHSPLATCWACWTQHLLSTGCQRPSALDMLGVLQPWHQRILSRIVILEGIQIDFIDIFLNWAHVTIHFKGILDFKLLVKHIFILLLLILSLVQFEILHFLIMQSLQPRLILVEILGVV